MGVLLAVGAHVGARAELNQALAMLTTEPAHPPPRAPMAWPSATGPILVVWDAAGARRGGGRLAPRAYVIKSGRVSVVGIAMPSRSPGAAKLAR